MTKYTIDYFIKKFQKIPANKFCTGKYTNEEQRCASGWIHEGGFSRETDIWLNLFYDNLKQYPSNINDGVDKRYQQKTIKGRIMAALKDIKRLASPNS